MTDAERKFRQWIFADKTAADALALAASVLEDRIKYGFSYTADTARLCIFEPAAQTGCAGALTGASGKAAALKECDHNGTLSEVSLDGVFQLCLFGEDFELRWERLDGGKGQITVSGDTGATLSKEQSDALGKPVEPPMEPNVCWRDRDHVYLLWGKPSKGPAPSGWTRLTSARIGALWVPWAAATEEADKVERIVLTAREYFATGEMGNVACIGERLTGFRPARDDDAELAGMK